jgi:hypothetical protein
MQQEGNGRCAAIEGQDISTLPHFHTAVDTYGETAYTEGVVAE